MPPATEQLSLGGGGRSGSGPGNGGTLHASTVHMIPISVHVQRLQESGEENHSPSSYGSFVGGVQPWSGSG